MVTWRRCGLGGLILALATWSSAACADWVTVIPLDGSFTASMPVQPRFIMDSGNDKYDNIMTYIMSENGRVFAVSYADVKPGVTSGIEQLIEIKRDDFVKSIRAKLTGSEPTQFHNVPGDPRPALEFSAVSDKATCKGMVIADGMRLYQLAACTRKGVDAPEDVERMLSSFAITPAKN